MSMRKWGGSFGEVFFIKCPRVGVMKDKELKIEEIAASHTLGGAGENGVQGRGKWESVLSRLVYFGFEIWCLHVL